MSISLEFALAHMETTLKKNKEKRVFMSISYHCVDLLEVHTYCSH